MKKLSSNEVRNMWLEFFKNKGHEFLKPASLIPVDDPSLLWINSGVATLKPYFDGRKVPPSNRLTNSQKSIRTNDIENVGITARHQTMFEMLGNFSIGDYFKKEAIEFAWELLTDKKYFDMDKKLLYITVFEEDNDAYEIWTKIIGIPKDHIFKGNRDTNFWDVGQGPCGPNTEIFFDRGEKYDPKKIGVKLLKDDLENDRYIEIWNIVFSQFNNDNNSYTELPRKNIDTGAGLERLVSIFQNTPTNFETDLFLPTIKETEKLCKNKFQYSIKNYDKPVEEQTKINTAFKVIADHIRASAFAIADGVFPGNKDRAYIIRRLIRRGSMYGRKLGINEAFLYKLIDQVIISMGDFYPYISEQKKSIQDIVKTEEDKFLKTLSVGFEHIENIILKENKISGENALLLFESYGFPIELTSEIAIDRNVKIDIAKFQKLFEKTKDISRSSRKDGAAWNKQSKILTSLNVESEFIGYEKEESEAKVIFMFKDDKEIKSAKDEEVFIILDKTPFYAEKGGQVGDSGNFITKDNISFKVIDTQQGPNNQHIHKVIIKGGEIKINQTIKASIDSNKRFYTAKNHSGTHILHAAIREVLGKQAMQAGSHNDQHGLRIDISFNRHSTADELKKISEICDEKIKKAIKREVIYTDLDTAVNKHGALAFFTEKYDQEVRIVKFGKFSCELCGGTHVEDTSVIEELLVTHIESKGSGIFRWHAITSHKEIAKFLAEELEKIKKELKDYVVKYNETKTIKVDKLFEEQLNKINSFKINKENLKELKKLFEEFQNNAKLYFKKIESLSIDKKMDKYNNIKPIDENGVNKIELEVDDLDMKEMKSLSDNLKNKFDNLVAIIFNKSLKIIIISVSEKISDKFSAIEIFKNYKKLNLKGGGNNTFAQGKIL